MAIKSGETFSQPSSRSFQHTNIRHLSKLEEIGAICRWWEKVFFLSAPSYATIKYLNNNEREKEKNFEFWKATKWWGDFSLSKFLNQDESQESRAKLKLSIFSLQLLLPCDLITSSSNYVSFISSCYPRQLVAWWKYFWNWKNQHKKHEKKLSKIL